MEVQSNAWVESYLDALLSTGLSKEYVKGSDDSSGDGEKDVFAQYFVQQLMNTDQEGVVKAWQRATAGGVMDTKDARLEYLSWRVWTMQQMRERQQQGPDARHEEDEQLEGGSSKAFAHHFDADGDSTPFGDSQEGPQYNDGQLVPSPRSAPTESSADALPRNDKLPPLRVAKESEDVFALSPRASSQTPTAADTLFANRVDKLYIVLVSMHGLIRGEKMELGKDADTGGQVKYVVELAKNLALHPMVHRVDLLTRLIEDPKVDASYGVETELLAKGAGKLGGAYIVRVAAGDTRVYIPKEELWPHVREFADNALVHAKALTREMAHEGEPCELYAVHGHYADGGEVAALVAHTLDVEMVLTGHSLGRNKLDHLLKSGTATRKQIEEAYKITRRIEGEERALDAAIMVLSSTQVEIDQQWGLYNGFDPSVAKALRNRKRPGRHMARMIVIPPGLEFSSYRVELPSNPMQLYIDYKNKLMDKAKTMFSRVNESSESAEPADLHGLETASSLDSAYRGAGGAPSLGRTQSRTGKVASYMSLSTLEHEPEEPAIWKEVHRFLRNPGKPVVLAMSRPDAKKNITTLVKAFGSNPTLRKIANLVLIMGSRGNINALSKGSQTVLQEVLKLIDIYDLYGSVAYPKAHSQQDISDIYKLATKTRGVFTNIALQEPFGLTLIEAAVHGAPIVATTHGGPVDIIRTLKNGKLVEPTDVAAVGQSILDIVTDKSTWSTFSTNGVSNILAYSWPSHCIQYLEAIEREKMRDGKKPAETLKKKGVFHNKQVSDNDNSIMSNLNFGSMDIAALMARSNISASVLLDDDISTLFAGRFTDGVAATLRLTARDRMAFAALDNSSGAPALAALLNSAFDRRDDKVALGVLSVYTFQETLDLLTAQKFDPKRLDFVICNAGAYIMCLDSKGEWVSDEAWEAKVLHHWDKQFVMRTLTRMSLGRVAEMSQQDARVLKLHTDATLPEDADDGKGPLHCMLDFSTEHSRMAAIDHATFMGYVQKHVRSIGIRCNLMLQLVPQSDSGDRSVLHATPLRASRALALRHLVHLHSLSLAKSTFLCTPASLHRDDKDTLLGALCSDLATLVQARSHSTAQIRKKEFVAFAYEAQGKPLPAPHSTMTPRNMTPHP